jgi:EAL domain-containing protein (putative c-di-GMP-specific phosphodiesterase class I)
VAPESVILEITETVAVPTTALIDAHVIDDLRDRGYVVVFDDIGGNWLPAEHLLSVGVNGLKADRTVGSSLHTPAGRAIARALTALTAELGQFLVIEGIETAEQAHQARIIGARYGQGYLWSPARPAWAFPMLEIHSDDRPA